MSNVKYDEDDLEVEVQWQRMRLGKRRITRASVEKGECGVKNKQRLFSKGNQSLPGSLPVGVSPAVTGSRLLGVSPNAHRGKLIIAIFTTQGEYLIGLLLHCRVSFPKGNQPLPGSLPVGVSPTGTGSRPSGIFMGGKSGSRGPVCSSSSWDGKSVLWNPTRERRA
ncbi:hypothetical protein EV421DRAFT_1746655 [Armillaria borealis]|uniref:Uncharacterized protein n=1 Tax=Armillaria borealis TaxID=47425 RepID=A0AA39IEB7_9AGAR|nr:hypothetical protein EV421DRAFT_1746655 [Armillaria borealis]